MDVSAPLFKYGLFGDDASLVVAIVIGFGFGFALERAGFGSAKKLTAQFYLTDLSVFKVMFTAIVTAMFGLHYLASFGVLDLGLVYVEPTHLVPQIVGGLVLGAGFIVGGYCPGTAVVAVASGRRDAIFYLVGMALGVLGFGEVYSLVERFYLSADMGAVTLPDVLHASRGTIVFAVALVALGCFWGAEWIERRNGKAAAVPTHDGPAVDAVAAGGE